MASMILGGTNVIFANNKNNMATLMTSMEDFWKMATLVIGWKMETLK